MLHLPFGRLQGSQRVIQTELRKVQNHRSNIALTFAKVICKVLAHHASFVEKGDWTLGQNSHLDPTKQNRGIP